MLFLPTNQSLAEHLAKHVVVGLFLKLQGLNALEVPVKNQAVFTEGLEEVVDLSHLFESTNLGILLGFVVNLHSLPG